MPLMSAMAARLKRAGRRSRYRLRKQAVEPVFKQMKQAGGFRQFSDHAASIRSEASGR